MLQRRRSALVADLRGTLSHRPAYAISGAHCLPLARARAHASERDSSFTCRPNTLLLTNALSIVGYVNIYLIMPSSPVLLIWYDYSIRYDKKVTWGDLGTIIFLLQYVFRLIFPWSGCGYFLQSIIDLVVVCSSLIT